MKPRHLLAITPLVVLWMRQLRFERRISNRQGRWERETTQGLRQILDQWQGEVGKELETSAKEARRWSEKLVEQISKALSGTPGGARR